jgi:hypothetical protein
MPIAVFLEQIAYSVGGGWIHTRLDCCPRRLFAIVDPYFAQPSVPSCVQLGTDARVALVGGLRHNIFHGAYGVASPCLAEHIFRRNETL